MCFFDEENGAMFTGDNLYYGMIYLNYPSTDPEAYDRSIRKMYAYRSKIKKLLPAHHQLDIETDLLDTVVDLLDGIKSRGELRHGTGIVAGKNISLSL